MPRPSRRTVSQNLPNQEPKATQLGTSRARNRRLPCETFSDLDPRQWRDLTDIELSSLWLFPSRGRDAGHRYVYHGNCVPQILHQLLRRYTKQGDVVLDLFLGSGTAMIEALRLDRRCIGLELQTHVAQDVATYISGLYPGRTDHHVLNGNSQDTALLATSLPPLLSAWDRTQADFLFLHPPYADIIVFSDNPSDLSQCPSVEAFLDAFERVASNGLSHLAPGKFVGLVIGDKYAQGEWIPLGFYCMQRLMQLGCRLKSIVVKNMTGNERGKGKATNLWRYRAMAGGFYLFDHEYVMIFQKP